MARPGIGILGGTFNPPHLGHLLCAQEAMVELGLERVILVPAARPPHKDVEHDPGAQERLALCRAAVAGDPRLSVDDLELRRDGPSYTVDTLQVLHGRFPDRSLTFLVGADMALSLPGWHRPERLLELATLGVVGREGARRKEIVARLGSLVGTEGRIRFFDMPRMDISSSMVRERVMQGRPVRYLVPDGVAERIEAGGLYRARSGDGDEQAPRGRGTE